MNWNTLPFSIKSSENLEHSKETENSSDQAICKCVIAGNEYLPGVPKKYRRLLNERTKLFCLILRIFHFGLNTSKLRF